LPDVPVNADLRPSLTAGRVASIIVRTDRGYMTVVMAQCSGGRFWQLPEESIPKCRK
jgi:hypothetical protein